MRDLNYIPRQTTKVAKIAIIFARNPNMTTREVKEEVESLYGVTVSTAHVHLTLKYLRAKNQALILPDPVETVVSELCEIKTFANKHGGIKNLKKMLTQLEKIAA